LAHALLPGFHSGKIKICASVEPLRGPAQLAAALKIATARSWLSSDKGPDSAIAGTRSCAIRARTSVPGLAGQKRKWRRNVQRRIARLYRLTASLVHGRRSHHSLALLRFRSRNPGTVRLLRATVAGHEVSVER